MKSWEHQCGAERVLLAWGRGCERCGLTFEKARSLAVYPVHEITTYTPSREQLAALRQAIEPRNCGNCAHALSAENPTRLLCQRINYIPSDLIEHAPTDRPVMLASGARGARAILRVVATFRCSLWSDRGEEIANQKETA